MHTAQLLSQALDAARRLGYEIREDSLEGAGGGHCLIRGKKWLLQLSDVLDALRVEPDLGTIELHPALAERISSNSKAA